MKFKHLLLSSTMTLGAFGTVQAVDILVENFETDGQGSRYVSSPEFNDGSNDHWGRTDGLNISNVSGEYSGFSGTQFWATEDTDDNGGNTNDEQTLAFTGIDITGLQNLNFSALFGAGNASGSGASADGGYDNTDGIVIQYQIDGGGYVDGMCFSYEAPASASDTSNEPLTLDADCQDFADHTDGTNRLSPAMQAFDFDIIGSGSTLDILITVHADSAKEEIAFDHIVISTGSNVDEAPEVASTLPANGATDVAVDATITVNFSEVVDVTASGMTLTCDAQTVTFSGLPATGAAIEITPDADLSNAAACSVNVVATEVTDQDGNVDNMAADYDFTFVVVAAPQVREIYEIQGSGLTSPYVGSTVITENNIVTALDTNGFFMQTPDARDDMDVNTSNGIYVYTGNNVPVSEGDDINVMGEVAEYFDSTQFGFGSTIVVNSSGNALPTAITFDESFPPTDPTVAVCSTDQEVAKYECMEGMLVDMPQGIISSAFAAFFGANISDLKVKAGASRAFREAGVDYPGVGGSIPTFDGNPEVFEVDIDELLLQPAYYSAGSEIAIEGVIGYNFNEYEVWPKSITVLNEHVIPSSVRTAQPQEVTVASFNVYRLFDDVNDPGEEDDDNVPTSQEFQDKVAKLSGYIVNTLKAPMIVAVQEVENLNALTALANQLNTDSGLNYTPQLIEGNDRGGIDVGVLYQSHVTIQDINQLGKDTVFDFDQSLLHDRPPLHVQADVSVGLDSMRMNLLIVHLRSRGSIDDDQEGHRVRLKRLTQANDVAAMVADIENNSPGESVVVLGDFNAFQFTDGYVDVMGQIDGTAVQAENTLWSAPEFAADPLTQAVQSMPADDQYSYVYQGDAQVLDNAVLNEEALLPFADIQFGRGNADANIDFETDTMSPLRASDHDGFVLYFTVELDVIFRNGFED